MFRSGGDRSLIPAETQGKLRIPEISCLVDVPLIDFIWLICLFVFCLILVFHISRAALIRIFSSFGILYIGQDKIWNHISTKWLVIIMEKRGVSSLRRSIPERCGMGRPTQVGDSAT